MAVVTGKPKREVGLAVLAEFTGRVKKRNIATILHQGFEKKKEKYSGHFEIVILNITERCIPVFYSKIYAYIVIFMSYL